MKTIYAEASGNTFIIFDRLEDISVLEEAFLDTVRSRIINENRDDALILTKEGALGKKLSLTMHVFGHDGTFGKFCGNGSRAVAAYLFATYPAYDEFDLVTPFGPCHLERWEKDVYATEFPINPVREPFIFEGKEFVYGEALEPHLTLEEKLSDEELYQLGKKLNGRRDLFPEGINVNAWQKLGPNTISVKTYERGVQRLTKSCGSGSAVSALVFLQGSDGKVQVETPGGRLTIAIRGSRVTLIGHAIAR